MIFDLIAMPPKWVLNLPPPLSDILQTLLSPPVLGALAIGSIAMFVLSAAGEFVDVRTYPGITMRSDFCLLEWNIQEDPAVRGVAAKVCDLPDRADD